METRLPDGRVLTEKELEDLKKESREWVRRMLEMACVPCSSHAIEEIEQAVKQIVDIYVTYGYVWNGKLNLSIYGEQLRDNVLSDLIKRLEELVYTYAEAAEKDDDDKAILIAWLKERYKGGTTESRIRSRVNAISGNLFDILEGDALSNGGVIPSDIAVAVGTIVGTKGLKRLLETEVTRGWQHKWSKDHSDAMFVHVFRGSSYPCDICDDVVSLGWQPVGSATVPPIHPNCKCYAVYI